MTTMRDDLRAADAVLTTHVLDMATGQPGGGVKIELYRLTEHGADELRCVTTNADGRCDGPLLTSGTAEAGRYLLNFHVGDYLSGAQAGSGSRGFFDIVPVEFDIADPDGHHHVPLILAPWGYSTYRGAPPDRPPRDKIGDDRPARGAPGDNTTNLEVAPPPGSGPAGLTTHVIDIAQGHGAGGLTVDLFAIGGERPDWEFLSQHRTTPEGRTASWLIEGGRLTKGVYELRFRLGDYFAETEVARRARPFFHTARVRFLVADSDAHHHVPLLAAPWGYTTYRGS